VVRALLAASELRAGTLDPRAWPELPTIKLVPLVGDGELDALRAYEAGSDHHLPAGAGYLHQRAVLQVVARRASGATRRVHRVGAIEFHTAAREVRVAGALVELSAMEFLEASPLPAFPPDHPARDNNVRRVALTAAAHRREPTLSSACPGKPMSRRPAWANRNTAGVILDCVAAARSASGGMRARVGIAAPGRLGLCVQSSNRSRGSGSVFTLAHPYVCRTLD
jgi:hypothetical protein